MSQYDEITKQLLLFVMLVETGVIAKLHVVNIRAEIYDGGEFTLTLPSSGE